MGVQPPLLLIIEVVGQPDGFKAELLDTNPVLSHDAVARKRRSSWITVAPRDEVDPKSYCCHPLLPVPRCPERRGA